MIRMPLSNALTLSNKEAMMNTPFHGRLRLFAVPAAAVVLAACATPMKNAALDDARALYQQAASDSDAVRSAPLELRRAQQALQQAESVLAAGGEKDVIDHQAYLARQRAATALQAAEIARADQAVSTAGAERNRILMAARVSEAEQARLAAEKERAKAEQARAQVAEAQAKAAQSRIEAEKQMAAAEAAKIKLDKLNAQLKELQAQQTDRGMVLTLGDVLFDSGRADLKTGAFDTLDRLVGFLRENPERSLKVEGHTDSVGSDSLNVRLSQARADAVRSALRARGIDGARITTEGLGKTRPIAGNETAAGRQRNRRVEIIISNPS